MAIMQAVRAHARGGPEQLVVEDAPRPEPGTGEALVRVHAAGITPWELDWVPTWRDRAGHERTPTIPSHEVSGVVTAVGDGATHVVPGDEVYGLIPFDSNGAAAEFVAVRARDLALKPRTIDHLHTAAVPLSALTAWQAFVEQAPLVRGDRVLVHGGAGGVGAFAIQIARHLGACVYATASRQDLPYVRRLGAEAIDYRADLFEDVVAEIDVVLDPIGGETSRRSMGVLRPGGRLVALAGPPERSAAEAAGVRASFFIVEPDREQLEELAELIDAGNLRVDVGRVFPLVRAREAYEYGRGPHGRGKIVLDALTDRPPGQPRV
jgi:NADPH:quinone reductase-like Zn-dependent oxidoreductase